MSRMKPIKMSQLYSPFNRDERTILNAISALLILGILGILALAFKGVSPLAALSNALLVGGAAFVVGVLTGFLFGIPRTAQNNPAPNVETTGSANGRTLQNNTNLEQISDWLTKIIIGVGLVELRRLPELIRRLGSYLFDASCPALTQGLLIAIVLFFFGNGFLAGYLMTRTFLTSVFKRIEDSLSQQLAAVAMVDLAIADKRVPVAAKVDEARSGSGSETASASIEKLLEEIEAKRLSPSSLDAPLALTVANAYYHRNQFRQAIPFFRRSLEDSGRLPDAELKYALSLGKIGYRTEAVERLEMLKGVPDHPAEVHKLLGYLLLWFPDRLNEALDHTTEYLERTGNADGGAILNQACAHAQLFSQMNPTDPQKASNHRGIALSLLRDAIGKNSALKETAQGLVRYPDDFMAFADDPTFQAIIS